MAGGMGGHTAAGLSPTPVGERVHPVHRFSGRCHGVLDEILEVPTYTLNQTERAEALAELVRAKDRFDAVIAQLIDDDPTSAAGLRDATTLTASSVRQLSRRAETLAAHPQTKEALASGDLRTEQAHVITTAVDRLPEEVAHLAKDAEDHLLGLAVTLDARALKIAASHLLEVIAPDQADELLAKQLQAQEKDALRTSFLKTYRDGHGSTYGKFKIPDAHGTLLATLIAAIANPQRTTPLDRTDRDLIDVHGAAFCELLERTKTQHLPHTGGAPVSMIITMTLDTLQGGLKAAGILGTDVRLSPSQARRWAARHDIIPAVLDGNSQILDLGRTQRLFTRTQRLAMALRQHGLCNIQGCDVPTAWCDANHRNNWARGGNTDLKNGELICPQHHTDTHQGKQYPRRT